MSWSTWDTIATRTVVLRITSAGPPPFPPATAQGIRVRITRAAADDISSELMLGIDQGGIEVARYSNMRPVPNGSFFAGGQAFGDFTNGIDAFATLTQGGLTNITIAGSPVLTLQPNLTTHTAGAGDPAGGPFNYQQATYAPLGLSDGVKEKLRIIQQLINADPNVPWIAQLWGYHLALKKKSGTINDSAAVSTGGAPTVGNGFIANTRQYSLGAVGTSPFQSPGTAGNDGAAPGVVEYGGDPLMHTGFYALDKVDLFNLMVLPGDREVDEATYLQVIGPASIYCQQHRAFLLIDAPGSWTNVDLPVADASAVNALRALVVKDHSAVFYPKVAVQRRGTQETDWPIGHDCRFDGAHRFTSAASGRRPPEPRPTCAAFWISKLTSPTWKTAS